MTEENSEDERDIELSALKAIFPELSFDTQDSHSVNLDLNVAPTDGVTLTFDPSSPITPPHKTLSLSSLSSKQDEDDDASRPTVPLAMRLPDLHHFTHLPPISVHITLPDKYPEHSPPLIELSTEPSWISSKTLQYLQDEIRKLWEEYDRTQVVYAYIDFLQQQAEYAFVMSGQPSVLAHELKAPLLEFDQAEKKRRFELDTFDCGICLEPKKGSSCYRLRSCAHVFCIGCLQDFYNSAITEGDITSIKCLAPDCGKLTDGRINREIKQHTLHPTELLDIPLERAQVQRYVDIKRKKKFESDKSTVYCPRKFCQAPARSAKYAKYESAGIEDFPDSDSEDAAGDGQPADPGAPVNLNATVNKMPEDRLSICSNPKCAYAFCRICQRSWHGDFLNCLPPSAVEARLSAEDKASYDYIRLNTSPCPTCEAPCQKTHGCNHMRCFTCNTHFCYLCSAWLAPGNPYQHFNTSGTMCYMRLWELEEGDEGQRQGVFGGPRAAEQAAVFAAQFDDNDAIDENVVAPPEPPLQRNAIQMEPNARPARLHGRLRGGNRRHGHGNAEEALQRFLRLAANDEEDGWDSDELEFNEEQFG